MPNGQSRNEDILMGMQVEPPLSRVESLLIDLINSGGGGGGGGGGTPGVSAFNGRRGNVLPQRGDYTADKINTSRVGKTAQDYCQSTNHMAHELARNHHRDKTLWHQL